MKNLYNSIIVELMKLRRSKVVIITIGFFIFIPIMMCLLMLVAQHPDIAAKLGIVGTKANMFGSNNWAGFFEMMSQLIAAIGLIGFGFVISWVFGREHIEHTITSIIALPIKRHTIVFSKFIVAFLWCFILTVVMFASGIISGKLTQIPEWSGAIFNSFSKIFFITALLTFVISTPVAFISGWSRGIIAPIGFVIVSVIMAQIISLIGLGPVFPWAIPGIYTVQLNQPGFTITSTSYIIVAITSILGVWGTIEWWNRADHC